MTALKAVHDLIVAISPRAICNDCIAAELNLGDAAEARRKCRDLAGKRGFELEAEACSVCGSEKSAISYRETAQRPGAAI